MVTYALHHGDCLDVLRTLPDASVDAVVTDPPYGLSFMGKRWDADVPSIEVWQECLRVAKPGAHLLSFAGARTQHRMAVAIEDAGWFIRDMIMWLYGSGFPKSHDVSKAIDKHGGQKVAWFGPWFRKWREQRGITQKQVAALFPSKNGGLTGCVANWELGFNLPTPEQFNSICEAFGLPFKSIQEAEREVVGRDTKARSTSGKSALPTVGGQTVYESWDITTPATDAAKQWQGWGTALKPAAEPVTLARKPLEGTVAANVMEHGCGALNIDGCRVGDETISQHGRSKDDFGFASPEESGRSWSGRWPANVIHDGSDDATDGMGSAARFFYCAKASKADRGEGNTHATVKPSRLMRYLCRLITPPSGVVLDPFMGSGSTGKAALLEGFQFIGIEREAEYIEIARARIEAAKPEGLFA